VVVEGDMAAGFPSLTVTLFSKSVEPDGWNRPYFNGNQAARIRGNSAARRMRRAT